MTAVLTHLIVPINHLFDRLYQSKYNPFYRSGTLAVGLLALVFLTGLYLLVFYDVAAPYQSIQRLQDQIWIGRWMRALHRYATDACAVAVVYHILQGQIQGKTWGPRTLAWISGVILLVVLWISAWTGYVMVWDTQGQVLAMAGARMMQSVPFLNDALGQAFNGSNSMEASFFFMNLFLHIVLPLGMIFVLWVHTAKLARSVWIPLKPIMWVAGLALLALSVLWPAPLLPEADLFTLPGVVEVDWFFAFWLPVLSSLSPQYSLLFVCGILVVGLSLPWWWKPAKDTQLQPSTSDTSACTGCGQCSADCPYEAISMVPRDDGRLPHSQVNPALCVSCGICSASCDDLAIGPPHSIGATQQMALQRFNDSILPVTDTDVIAVFCEHNPGARRHLERYIAEHDDVRIYPTGCIGTMHTQILEQLLTTCGGVFVWGCPTRNCLTREGVELLNLRTFHKRPPSVSRRIDKRRVTLESFSAAEGRHVFTRLDWFRQGVRNLDDHTDIIGPQPSRVAGYIKGTLASAALLLLIGALSRVPMGETPTEGVLRIGAQVPGLVIEECRDLSAEELAALPLHMRRPTECEKIAPTYMLTVSVDGVAVLARAIEHAGVHADRPLALDEDITVAPGSHQFAVDLRPQDISLQKAPKLRLATTVDVERSRIYLVGYNHQEKSLELRR
ncbi:MAG: 4Fe-4S binding protein [Gemmatimonadetes bacterium]|nr:4Fe-4S binding protein [Gemmatimonadota bacterium]MBT5142699.1 4Fe-4S binding protein [Gemmatimonadota bacterium]MBT5587675.1 4Fe-4S binding protein [Gemmatimonadota bacterium]MBT5960597.1 4Fe-4S binding protein [Gemmatimonadota bacterium]MBT6626552.1 4Fe-4S binding protein [Gemmatimonadota bacterium]